MTSFLAVTGFPPVCYRGRPPASPRFQGFLAECRPASGRPPVRNLVDPYTNSNPRFSARRPVRWSFSSWDARKRLRSQLSPSKHKTRQIPEMHWLSVWHDTPPGKNCVGRQRSKQPTALWRSRERPQALRGVLSMTACTTYSGILCEDLQGVGRGWCTCGGERRGRRLVTARSRTVRRSPATREGG